MRSKWYLVLEKLAVALRVEQILRRAVFAAVVLFALRRRGAPPRVHRRRAASRGGGGDGGAALRRDPGRRGNRRPHLVPPGNRRHRSPVKSHTGLNTKSLAWLQVQLKHCQLVPK